MSEYTKEATPTISQVYDEIQDMKGKIETILRILEEHNK